MQLFALAGSVLNLLLAVLVLYRQRAKETNILFSSYATFIALWGFSLIAFKFSPQLILLKLAFLFGVLIATTFLFFTFYFPDNRKPYYLKNQLIYTTLIISLVTIVLVFSPFLVPEAHLDTRGGIRGELGVGYPFYVATILLFLLGGFVQIFKKYRRFTGLARYQIKYFFLGSFISFALVVTSNLILPSLGIFEYNLIGTVVPLIQIGFISYSMIQYRLLDIRVVITRSLVFGVLVGLVALGFIFITFLSAQFFGGTPASRTVIAFLVAVIIVAGLDPLKRLLSRATDKVFFKARIDYGAVLRQLTEILSVELNLEKLITNISHALEEQLKIKYAAIALRRGRRDGSDVFEAYGNPNPVAVSVLASNPLIKYLQQKDRASIFEVLGRKIEDTQEGSERRQLEAMKAVFEKTNAAVIAPVTTQNKLNALLVLGPKLSGESYSNEDLQLVEVLGPQIGSAIQKANLYEEVRAFGAKLQKRVEEATAELKERNVSLLTLQTITRDVTRTLDFNKVVQNIADSVAKRLGYVGAILVFVDDDGKTLRARAITNTPLTSKAMKLLPKPFYHYTTDLTDPKTRNLAHDVIKTGQIRFSESFAEVVSPPVPKILVNTIQKLVGVKTIVIVPIVSEEKVIGVIEIGVRKAQEEISEREIETMQSVADQLGVVSRNLTLFQQLRQANEELEIANRHLQQLDQAKSEFVSIASHQLRTPMTGIMGYLSMLTTGDFGSMKEEHARILRNLLLESQRMIRLINLFLNVTKIEAGKFEYHFGPANIADLIEKEIREVAKLADEKKLKLIFERPKKPLPEVHADQDKIQDVLLNLLDNAIKYTHRGGVTISVESGPAEVVVVVRDTGIGIPPEQTRELFNKFVRGSGVARIQPDGSGLGLFIAKRVVEGHGGRIWVESAGTGKGSTFKFSLPVRH